MSTVSQYAEPLVVRYDNLIALIRENVDLAATSVGRASAFNDILFKLRQWSDRLTYESSTQVTAGPDVLEALEASNIAFLDKVHELFSKIALAVKDCPPGFDEHTFNWNSWSRSLNQSIFLELDKLIWPLRHEYEKQLSKSSFSPPRPSLVLCLDGGGVRSFSSLLILQTLMLKTQLIIDKNNLPLQRPVRPRDFFDYIFGTSSGGMIAVMLGRLQMTVDDCITCFIEFGDGTFARPRLLHNYAFLFFGRSKYGEGTIHKVVQKVVDDFVPGKNKAGKGQQHTFAALDDKCKTGVWACISQSLGSQPRLFRTYNHDSTGTLRPYLRNPGLADSSLVWSVARATSAAPYFFDEAMIEGNKFVDGGLIINNPCPESYFEVDCLHQQRLQRKNSQVEGRKDSRQQASPSVSVLVSIGSGLRPLPKSRSKVGLPGMDRVTGLIDRLVWATWTSTERAHEQMERVTWQTETKYYRFNVQDGIGSVRQDEWKKGKHHNETLSFIERMTTQYTKQSDVEQQLQSCAEYLVKLRRKQL